MIILTDKHNVLKTDRKIVKFETVWYYYLLYTINLYVHVHVHVCCQNPVHGKVCSIQHYVMKFASDLRQVSGFLWVLRFPLSIKLTAWNICNLIWCCHFCNLIWLFCINLSLFIQFSNFMLNNLLYFKLYIYICRL